MSLNFEIKRHPEAVYFDEVQCCAFEKAHKETNKPSLAIFSNTIRLSFILRECDKKVLLRNAEEEIRELEKGDRTEKLDCGHTREEHINALKQISYVLMNKLKDKYSI